MRWLASLVVLCLTADASACPIRVDVQDPQREEIEAARSLAAGHGRRLSTLPSDSQVGKRTVLPLFAVLTSAPDLTAPARQLLVAVRAAYLAPSPVRTVAASSRGPPLRTVVDLTHLTT